MYMCTTTRWWGIKLGSIEIRATFRAKLPDDLHDTKWYVHFCCTHDNPSLAIIWRTCEFLETCTVYCARSLSLSVFSLFHSFFRGCTYISFSWIRICSFTLESYYRLKFWHVYIQESVPRSISRDTRSCLARPPDQVMYSFFLFCGWDMMTYYVIWCPQFVVNCSILSQYHVALFMWFSRQLIHIVTN